ncbi:FAD-binding oxidoreductase [Aliishimia ponticola]|uniref:FAD-binding oxidoreductase n=1 Tax=Aliishimia ponticola TaxID=2499833 RepID=A0A4S4NBL9_9RHOB|nr:FAD-dependent oxidoreductase [Aliishimia ponticola]THH35418.1 FAD-binding oxidoreductase [Aliishimia ponticola]
MASVDVSVRGAGIFGLSVAWACVKAGAKVELVDPNGVAAGSSGGVVGALAPHVPENWNPKKQFQLESLLLAEEFWADVADVSGTASGYIRAGRIQPLADMAAVALAEERGRGAARLWGTSAKWHVTDSASGWQIGSGSGQYVHDTLSAHIHPRRACVSLAAALAARGVKVQAAPESPAAATVWATGATGLADLSHAAGKEIGRGIKGQAALLKLDRAQLPQLFIDGVHIVPHLDGTIAIGSTTEREFDDPTGTDALLDDVVARATDAVPELRAAAVLLRWAGLRPRARTRAPMLGPWPDRPGHFVANGGFKIGFGMAPKIAEVMARLVLDEQNEIPQGFHVVDNL